MGLMWVIGSMLEDSTCSLCLFELGVEAADQTNWLENGSPVTLEYTCDCEPCLSMLISALKS